MFHKDFPFQKGVWIWELKNCSGGNIDAIIAKCHTYDISYVLIKGCDGGAIYPSVNSPQLTHDVVTRLQSAGIKVYSWGYNYGYDPIAEANVAIKCLELGVNGHVFDAEAEFRDVPNASHVADVMLQMVRAKFPDKFLAHAPLAIIDYHTKFPYVTFGKYCDAAMPQVYWGTFKKTPQQAILWMYDNWSRWEKNWRDSGHGDSIKPIIPIGQAYDNYNITPHYVETTSDISTFISSVAGYKSINLWSWQHMVRTELWEAVRDAKVDPPSDADLGRVVVAHEETQPVQTAIEAPVSTVVDSPAAPLTPVEVAPEAPSEQTVTVIGIDQNGTHVEEVLTVPVVETPTTTEIITSATPAVAEVPQIVPQQTTPQKIELSPAESSTSVNVGQKTTIVLDPDANHPDGVKMTVTTHKTHQEYFIDFIVYLLSLFLKK